jgi:hypothetical protein
MDVSGQLHALTHLPLGKFTSIGIRGWVGLRGSLNIVERRNISYPCRKSNHDSSVIQTVAILTELSRHLYSGLTKYF